MAVARSFAIFAIAAMLVSTAVSQTLGQPSAEVDVNRAPAWEFSALVSGFIVPDDQSYASPLFTADHQHLHLEGRYNYEDQRTGSAWAGYNFSLGSTVELEVTPMLGGVFGRTNGIAPGYRFSLGYKKIALSSEGEYVFDTGNHHDSFFYTWNELTYSPLEWLHAGLVAQRTRAYQTSLDIQRGFLVGVSHGRLDFTTYVFNLGWTDPTCVLALGMRF